MDALRPRITISAIDRYTPVLVNISTTVCSNPAPCSILPRSGPPTHPFYAAKPNSDHLLWEHVLDLLVAQSDLVDRVALPLEGFEVTFDVGGEEDFWIRVRDGSYSCIE